MSAANHAPVPVARGLRAALAAIGEAMPTDLSADDVPAYRNAAAARATTAEAVADRLGLEVDDRQVGVIPVSVFRAGRAPAARVVFFHGGGLIAGDRFDGVDVVARHARDLGLEVWSVEYPLAPEHSFDAMIRAAISVVSAAAEAGAPVVIAGQSGGGGLAAATALACRDAGLPLAGQLLICPMLSRADTASARQFSHDPSWSPISNATAWTAALDGEPHVPPGERTDLDGLPPTFLDSGSAEVFRDAIVTYASQLWAHGCRAELHVWSGGFHGSDCAAEDAVSSIEAHRARREWLRRLLSDEL